MTLSDVFQKYENKPGFLIPLLQEVQNIEGYLSKEAIKQVSEYYKVKIAEIYGVATFYSMFRLKPIGKHTIRLCKGTACHVSGADSLLFALRNALKLSGDEETTADNLFTVIEVACLGCCSLAPAIMIDNKVFGNLTPDKVEQVITNFKQ
jgi:NADH-quinone oxidoreductase subunit E